MDINYCRFGSAHGAAMKQDKPFLSSRSWQGIVAANLMLVLPVTGAMAQNRAVPAKAELITPYVNARYRLETVDQGGFSQSATASTLRVRAALRTTTWHGLSALVEGDAVVRVGPMDYNDTVNGVTTRPTIADSSDVLLNQAYVRWQPARFADAVVGRQVVNLDNQRWVGAVDWRQNDQTLDAARIGIVPVTGARIDYVHGWRVNRVFGPDSPQGIWRHNDINLLHGSFAIPALGTLAPYGYWLDLPDAPALSSKTFGVRLSGERAIMPKAKLLYTIEYARQREHGANPRRFDNAYWLVEPGISVGPVAVRLGYERLEGDGTTALQTPLATLHAFNGWADKFLTTPANGLRDSYADIQWRLGPVFKAGPAMLRVQLHDFKATHGDIAYGREAGAWLTVPVSKHVTTSVKLSRYAADRFATDTTKFWFSVEARY